MCKAVGNTKNKISFLCCDLKILCVLENNLERVFFQWDQFKKMIFIGFVKGNE